jgi:hypothetical protein
MVPDKTMYGLTAFAVRHLGDTARIHNTDIRYLALTSGTHTSSLQFCTHGTCLGKIQFTPQSVINSLLVFKHIHDAKLRLSERKSKRILIFPSVSNLDRRSELRLSERFAKFI